MVSNFNPQRDLGVATMTETSCHKSIIEKRAGTVRVVPCADPRPYDKILHFLEGLLFMH